MILTKKEKGIENRDLKEVFFIVKGQYKRDRDLNTDGVCVSGFDPSDKETTEWYRVVDNVTYTTLHCSSDYQKALGAIKKIITRYKTMDKYLKGIKDLPPTAPKSKEMLSKIYRYYGDYYREDIVKQENLAYEVLEETPLQRTNRVLKSRPKLDKVITPTVEKDIVVTKEVEKLLPKKKGLVLTKLK